MIYYKFKCLQCGRKFKTDAALAAHEKSYHQPQEHLKRRIEHKKHEIHRLERRLPGSGKRTNLLAIIIFIVLILVFIYFMYFR